MCQISLYDAQQGRVDAYRCIQLHTHAYGSMRSLRGELRAASKAQQAMQNKQSKATKAQQAKHRKQSTAIKTQQAK